MSRQRLPLRSNWMGGSSLRRGRIYSMEKWRSLPTQMAHCLVFFSGIRLMRGQRSDASTNPPGLDHSLLRLRLDGMLRVGRAALRPAVLRVVGVVLRRLWILLQRRRYLIAGSAGAPR